MSRANPRFRRVNPHLPPVGGGFGIVMYRLVGLVENQLTITTFTYSSAVPLPTAAQLSTLLTNISTNLRTSFAACLSSSWTLSQERIDVIHRNDVAGTFMTTNAGLAGSRAAAALPSTVAAVIQRNSVIKGQHGRGRISLPAIAEADVTGSKITAAALVAAMASLIVQMKVTASDGGNTWTPCITERAPTSPKLAVGFSAMTTGAINTILGSVRRRKLGRGQ